LGGTGAHGIQTTAFFSFNGTGGLDSSSADYATVQRTMARHTVPALSAGLVRTLLTVARALCALCALYDVQVQRLADESGMTAFQVLLRWALQNNVAVIPGSSNPTHIQDNLDTYKHELSGAAMSVLDAFPPAVDSMYG
jgi:diketogulonate reductase-like aldo/keto reductase